MLHAAFMPSGARRREGLVLGALLALGVGATAAAEAPRVVSINVCTDQLVLALADPAQIAGLSPYSRDAARSWAAGEAARFPLLSGEAEDVLMLKPDLVLAGRFTKRATRELLKDKGLRVVEFDAARSVPHVREQIRRAAELLGHPARAADLIGRIDAAIARARAAVAQRPFRVLAVSRRGWISGSESLTSSLLSVVGLANAAGELGFRSGGFASLEAIVSVRPDFILVTEDSPFAEDQGRAFLLHPALERLYPPDRRLVVPERLMVCGGPMLAEAIDRLAAELERAGR